MHLDGPVVCAQEAACPPEHARGDDRPNFLQSAITPAESYAEMTRLQASRIAGDELTPNLPQCRIAAWLTREFKAAEHRLDAIERTRIDGLLERLARRFTLAGERALARIANELPQRPETAFLSQLESALSPLEPESFAPPIARDVATLLLSTLPASPASTIPA